MAATVTLDPNKPNAGSTALRIATVTLDAASGVADLGLNLVAGFACTPTSVATGGFGAEKNHTSGNIRIGSAASGDEFEVVAWGYC